MSHPANIIKCSNVYHHTIRGLRGKTDELLSPLHPVFPHILCFTEHSRRTTANLYRLLQSGRQLT